MDVRLITAIAEFEGHSEDVVIIKTYDTDILFECCRQVSMYGTRWRYKWLPPKNLIQIRFEVEGIELSEVSNYLDKFLIMPFDEGGE